MSGDNRCPMGPERVAGEFGPELLDEAACRRWFLAAMRGAPLTCPGCGAVFPEPTGGRVFAGKQVQCPGCGGYSSPKTGTLLDGSTLSFAQFVLLAALLYWGLPTAQIAERVGCTPMTVRNWRARFAAGAP